MNSPLFRFPTARNEVALPNFGAALTPTGGRLTLTPPTLAAREGDRCIEAAKEVGRGFIE